MGNKAIFLDRDGTINVEKNYIYKIEDFEFISGVPEALQMFKHAGFKLFILTNQSGIARGYYTEEMVNKLHDWMIDILGKQHVKLDGVYYCPHHPEAVVAAYRKICNCRKPKLAMFERVIREFDINLERSYAIGDKFRDLSICMSTPCKGYLLGENEAHDFLVRIRNEEIEQIRWAKDLYTAAYEICG